VLQKFLHHARVSAGSSYHQMGAFRFLARCPKWPLHQAVRLSSVSYPGVLSSVFCVFFFATATLTMFDYFVLLFFRYYVSCLFRLRLCVWLVGKTCCRN